NIGIFSWAAFDATYYTGGKSTVNGAENDDKVSNIRLGTVLALPTGKRSGLKISFSTGARVVKGSNFTTASIGWSYSWF
ncbi:MAG: transporter, partial [Bacteroidia bacterium]